MSKRFSRLFLLVAMTAFAAAVQARVILRQNFDDTAVFQPGPLAAVLARREGAVYAAQPGLSAVIEFSPGVDVNAFILKADGGAATAPSRSRFRQRSSTHGTISAGRASRTSRRCSPTGPWATGPTAWPL